MRVLVCGGRDFTNYIKLNKALDDLGYWDKYQNAAGPIRNQQMIDEGKPDICLAFPTKKSRGTWDMVSRCRKHNILVHIYEEESN